MDDSERYKLLYGPYAPPPCRVGDKLPCEYRGHEVVVRGLSDAPIPWPSTRRRGIHSPILCGDLVRAVERESAMAVAHHWGVQDKLVWLWRRALGVPAMTLGSRRLRIEYAAETLTPEVRAKARAAMHSAEVRAKLSAVRKGRQVHPNTRAALLEAAKRPKSAEWKRKRGERSRIMWDNREAYGLPPRHQWTDEENALLGTQPDHVIARLLGLTKNAVAEQRRPRGLLRVSRPWTDDEIALLGTASDARIARILKRGIASVARKRDQLGIRPARAVTWTAAEIALLGTASDPEIARRVGKNPCVVQGKRERLGIPPFLERWTEEELSWLGTDTDEAVAQALGRTKEAVKVRRKKAGIRAFRWD
jgi:hypothetical protein